MSYLRALSQAPCFSLDLCHVLTKLCLSYIGVCKDVPLAPKMRAGNIPAIYSITFNAIINKLNEVDLNISLI